MRVATQDQQKVSNKSINIGAQFIWAKGRAPLFYLCISNAVQLVRKLTFMDCLLCFFLSQQAFDSLIKHTIELKLPHRNRSGFNIGRLIAETDFGVENFFYVVVT